MAAKRIQTAMGAGTPAIDALSTRTTIVKPHNRTGRLRDVAREIGRTKFQGPPLGREARYLKPYLLAALDAVPPAHPLGR